MKDEYQVVVIGGGIVGCSVLYHLTLRGVTDIALIERDQLTAGSSWHAAGGFHIFNSDLRISELQQYTIDLYPQIEEESGQSVGLKMSGGLELAGTPERWRYLQSDLAWLHRMGHPEARLLTPDEAAEMVPIINPEGILGAVFDPEEGNLDPNGATHAYAGAARKRGAEIILENRVLSLTQAADGMWDIETEQGTVRAENVVNAGGLWARKVGRMVGVDHPLVPMPHHFLITDDIPEVAAFGSELMPAVTDLEGFTYLQREGNGVLLGVYEQNPRHWSVEGAPWDFGMTLFPEESDRISEELTMAFDRFPALQDVGIKRWVNGAFTFTPDGNPLVGPVEGIPGYWAACGVMAGYSQCAGIGLALCNWIVDGDPGVDAFGMDVARFGPYASNDTYLRDTTAQFYARRFVMAYPNEELPAGRPLKTTPCYDDFLAAGAQFTVNWGLEVPLYYAPTPDFEENDTLGRSNAEPIVAEETAAVRNAAGAYEIAQYARYEVSGPGAEGWLDRLVASKIPAIGKIRLAPMLGASGRLMGDLSVTRLGEERFWLTGSYYLQEWHQRWFRQQLLGISDVRLDNITDARMGFSLSGPASREIVERLAHDDVSNEAFPFLSVRQMDIGTAEAVVGRLSLTGELGYEIVVPANQHRTLLQQLREAGASSGLRLIGDRAVDSLRLEKGYGIWNAEFTQQYTPSMSGLDRFIDFDKDFIGAEAARKERDDAPAQRLVLLEVDADDADASRDDAIWLGDQFVGLVTSGAYGHHVDKSLALAYLDREVIESGSEVTVFVIGEPRTARVLPEVPYDPTGNKLRGLPS